MTSVDQTKIDQLRGLLAAAGGLFRRQGVVVATWRRVVSARTGETRKLGPYWSLRYRDEGRQRSFYLGRSAALVEAVRSLLTERQAPRRQILQVRRWRAAAKAALRRHKVEWARQLQRELGVRLKGFEVRGWTKSGRPRRMAAGIDPALVRRPRWAPNGDARLVE